MEDLFKTIQLEGTFKEAFEEAKVTLNIPEEDSDRLETIVGLVQLITKVEKLSLETELEALHKRLAILRKEATEYKIKYNAVVEANKQLTLENESLLSSLKAMKELSIEDDRINEISTSK